MTQKTRKRVATQTSQEARLRDQVTQLLGENSLNLREWNTQVCPDCYKDVAKYPECRVLHAPHLPALYYALVTMDLDDDMPLGIGPTAADALADLLWNLRATNILADLADLS